MCVYQVPKSNPSVGHKLVSHVQKDEVFVHFGSAESVFFIDHPDPVIHQLCPDRVIIYEAVAQLGKIPDQRPVKIYGVH